MSEHRAIIRWTLKETPDDFGKGRYSREHTWTFDGGVTISASPAPSNVPIPFSNPALVDPEEAFVAAIASCHFLTFAWLAAQAGYVLESYEDQAVGKMAKNDRGAAWVGTVTLNVKARYSSGRRPIRAEEERLHHAAHQQCFIANSVKTQIAFEIV